MIRKLLLSFFVLVLPVIAIAAQTPSAEEYVDIENGKLFCRVMGSGNPLIVIHDGPGLAHDYLLNDIGRLSSSFQVIFYDQRGCGRSTGDVNAESITLQNFVEDVEAVRQHFGFDTVTVLGHGWGGLLAANYLIAHTDAVEKLVLIDPLPINSSDYKGFQKDLNKLLAPKQSALTTIKKSPKFIAGDPATVNKYYQTYYSVFFLNPALANNLNFGFSSTNTLNSLKVADLLNQNTLSQNWDLKKALNKINTKTLVIHGRSDPIDKDDIRKYRDALPNGTFALVKQAGHFPFIEDRNTVFDSLRDFFKK